MEKRRSLFIISCFLTIFFCFFFNDSFAQQNDFFNFMTMPDTSPFYSLMNNSSGFTRTTSGPFSNTTFSSYAQPFPLTAFPNNSITLAQFSNSLPLPQLSAPYEATSAIETRVKEALAEEIITMADTLIHHVVTMGEHMETKLEQFQNLALETEPYFSESIEEFMQSATNWSTDEQDFIQDIIPIAASFAEMGMEFGAQFAGRGMELGYEFASKGEEVGPMANRILYMATQIGVMADRIGEMADRILFMTDTIGEFGDKILYVSQLIVYTEQLIVNVNVLINETIRSISDMILTMLAITTENNTYLQLRAQWMQNDNQALSLIYENMNRMLDHMHEFSLMLLENEAATKKNQLKVRELQLELRKNTLSANDCFCPGFCVDPDQCI